MLVSGPCPERTWDLGSPTARQSKLSHAQLYQVAAALTLL